MLNLSTFVLTKSPLLFVFGLQEYTSKQLTSLVTCGVGSHVTKKGKQKLLAIIEDMERSKAR